MKGRLREFKECEGMELKTNATSFPSQDQCTLDYLLFCYVLYCECRKHAFICASFMVVFLNIE